MSATVAQTALPRRAVLANLCSLEGRDLLGPSTTERGESAPLPYQSVGSATFRSILATFPTGVTVVTCRDLSGHPVGLTATAVASVSLDPPQLLACFQSGKYTLRAIRQTGRFVVNFLAGDQAALSTRFATSVADKFEGVDWISGPSTGGPVLGGTLAHAECQVENLIPSGDHTIVIGRIIGGVAMPGSPLLYYARRYASWPEISVR